MHFRKPIMEEVPLEDTAIWSCTQDDCKGWMRNNFSFAEEPSCPFCLSPMQLQSKMLPTLSNTSAHR